jgi:hypothetical protein
MRATLAFILAVLAACASPEASGGVKVIVGAKLAGGAESPPLDYSVVVIADGKIREAGPQSAVPVPKGAEIIRGLGKTIQPLPGGPPIEPGQPASFVLKGGGEPDRVMRNGEWVR